MRVFKDFENELKFPTVLKNGDAGLYVKKLQEFLNLQNIKSNFYANNMINTYGNFGPVTTTFVEKFQIANRLAATKIADIPTIILLTKNFRIAFTTLSTKTNFREAILEIANNHLVNGACEIYNPYPNPNNNYNQGPWVRAYCDGNDNSTQQMGPRWCAGFVRAILDMACDKFPFKYKKFMPNTLSCDDIANFAVANGRLIKNSSLITNLNKIKNGDVFLVYSTKSDEKWVHTGFITEISSNGKFISIEGNASIDSQITHAGYLVMKKSRNLKDVLYFDNSNKLLPTNVGAAYKQYYDVYSLDI